MAAGQGCSDVCLQSFRASSGRDTMQRRGGWHACVLGVCAVLCARAISPRSRVLNQQFVFIALFPVLLSCVLHAILHCRKFRTAHFVAALGSCATYVLAFLQVVYFVLSCVIVSCGFVQCCVHASHVFLLARLRVCKVCLRVFMLSRTGLTGATHKWYRSRAMIPMFCVCAGR